MALTPPTPESQLRLRAPLPNLPSSQEQLLEWAGKLDAAYADRDEEISRLLTYHVANTGTATISGADTSVAVTFGTPEPDAAYGVLACVNDLTDATPAAGSTRVWADDLATTGFTLKVETAPGGADTVTIRWIVTR